MITKTCDQCGTKIVGQGWSFEVTSTPGRQHELAREKTEHFCSRRCLGLKMFKYPFVNRLGDGMSDVETMIDLLLWPAPGALYASTNQMDEFNDGGASLPQVLDAFRQEMELSRNLQAETAGGDLGESERRSEKDEGSQDGS
ncbi:MAG: hypothetical protein AAFW60_00470 [Pseudomonadota bacterium]